LRKLMFGLLCQRTNAMSEDPDADVVKVIIGKRRYIALVVRQGVAEVAAGLAIKEFPTPFGRVADSVCVSSDEMVEDVVSKVIWRLREGGAGNPVAERVDNESLDDPKNLGLSSNVSSNTKLIRSSET